MTKPCMYCSKEIELVKTAQGWRPFNPHDLTPHDCPEGTAARAAKKSGGGGGYQKDSRSIEKQVCLKEAAETYRILYKEDKVNLPIFEDAMREIRAGYRILRDAILEEETLKGGE